MPECQAMYMLGYLFEMGPTLAAGMGQGPLTHEEISAWQVNTGIGLNAWEARTLRRLSLDYLAASLESKAPDCPAPWDQNQPAIDRNALIAKIKAAF